MADFELRLFGRFRLLRRDGGDLSLTGKKAQGLLAYLALNPDRRHTRERLAALLWDGREDEQGRHSLRQALLAIKNAAGDGDEDGGQLVVASGDELALNPDLVDVDASAFQRLAAEDGVAALKRALALYEGDLLDGLSTLSQPFDDWLASERRRLRDLACDTLARLARDHAGAGRADAAMEAAERLLALDPVREDGHRLLMRLHDEAGNRAAALRQYRTSVDTLRRELDAEPEPETTRLYEEIRARSGDTGESAPSRESSGPASPAKSRKPWRWWAAGAAGMTVIAAVLVWIFVIPQPPALCENPAIRVPKKPSIVILPFLNPSSPKDDDLVDGIGEDITSALANASEIFVIAHTTALTYKGRRVRLVAEKLKVRYVLEGSVRRFGDRVRISARLIDAKDGRTVWARAYDREVKNIFKLQDEITLNVITQLQVTLTEGEQEQIRRSHGTSNLQAWVNAGQALKHLRRLTPRDNVTARALYEEAITLDPNYPGAKEGLAWTFWIETFFGWSNNPRVSLRRAAALAQQALAIDDKRPLTYALLGSISLMDRKFDRAIALGEKAVALSPNGADVTALLALTLAHAGQPQRAVKLVKKAMRLSPYYPPYFTWFLARAYRVNGRHDDAIAACNCSIARDPNNYFPHVQLALIYMARGDIEMARAEARTALRLNPDLTIQAWKRTLLYKEPAIINRDIELLRGIGVFK